MRTAFLSAVKRTSNGGLRAELTLGGRSVLGWQVDLAQALKCERIICLCEAQSDEILDLQHQVEAVGGAFHTVRGTLQLTGLVHADDELVMLRDGLVPDRALVMELAGLGSDGEEPTARRLRQVIATLPTTHPLTEASPFDFERIDRERHWAGFAIMRAAHIHSLADLPPDGDAMSLLLRLALQARVASQTLEISAGDATNWLLALEQNGLREREQEIIAGSRARISDGGIGGTLAAFSVVKIAPRWLRQGSEVSAGIAAIFAAISLGLAATSVLGQSAALALWPLVVAILASLLSEVSIVWGRLRAQLWPRARRIINPDWVRALVDATFAAGLVSAHGITPNPALQIALPLIAVGLARNAGDAAPGRMSSFWRDRVLQISGFALAALGGVLSEALALFTLGAVAQLMLRQRAI
ncbi:MAG: hypothetical protein AAF697_01260 [Pseudomonadota bacterium]